jgi:hypothetical protein
MDADGDHLFKDFLRSVDVRDAFLDGPGSEAGCVDALAKGDGEVLVPGHFPVGAWAFVEENSAHRAAGSFKSYRGELPGESVCEGLSGVGEGKGIAKSGARAWVGEVVLEPGDGGG